MNPTYHIVDRSTWSRGALFQYYLDSMRVVMSLTVDMDVTPLVRYVKGRGLKFYPSAPAAFPSIPP